MAKTQPVSVRLSPEEREALSQLASAHDLSVNRVLIALVRAAIAPGSPSIRPDLAELVEARKSLDAVGRNLNQVVRALNLGKLQNVTIDGELLAQALDKTQGVARAVGRLVTSHRERTAHAIGAAKHE